MRKVLVLFTTILLLGSCQEKVTETKVAEAEAPVTDENMETFHKNVETAKAYFAAFSANDSTKMYSYISDDFIWSPPSVGNDSLPRAEFEKAMSGFMKGYTNKKLTDALYFAGLDDNQKPNGDVRVYGLWKSNFAESGADARLKWYAVLFFNEAGKITHSAEWYNEADLTKEF